MKRRTRGIACSIPHLAVAEAHDLQELLRTQDELIGRLVTPDLEPLFDIGQPET